MTGERSCYTCGNYYEGLFCGYIQSLCRVHGSLDCDQHERHPDITGATCPTYKQGEARRIEWKEQAPPRIVYNGLTEVEFLAVLDEMDKKGNGGSGNEDTNEG